jgi:hypothetical protein
MKVTFYPFAGGSYIQTKIILKVETLNKKELMDIADLRHQVLNRLEFYNALSTDINNKKRKAFYLLSNSNYLKVER